jgi:hypothetical protein
MIFTLASGITTLCLPPREWRSKLAVGCAVVVVDGRGLAGLVTSSLVDEWRRNNFGLRLLTREPTKEAIATEIGRYDARDAAIVSGRIREFASLSTYLDRVEAIHRDVVATPQVLADAPLTSHSAGSSGNGCGVWRGLIRKFRQSPGCQRVCERA